MKQFFKEKDFFVLAVFGYITNIKLTILDNFLKIKSQKVSRNIVGLLYIFYKNPCKYFLKKKRI